MNDLAKAWEEGRRVGMSRAMRYMSDEPGIDPAGGDNPYLVKYLVKEEENE